MELSDRYSILDRALHRFAFKTAAMQIELAAVENQMFRKRLAAIELRQPVFITSLPRAGTTLLLEVLSSAEEFASHTYRDMPFILLPFLSDYLARRARGSDPPLVERAHADGVLVGLDSPEAFEEMIWRAWWSEHYRSDRIVPWEGCDDDEFQGLFRDHLRKVIWLRRGTSSDETRYVSKNNGNIARIGALWDCCGDAVVVVPIRDPEQQALSLLRQHRRFLELHARDRFARRYMEGIGHFDFGENLLPVDLCGWLGSARWRDPLHLEFWLEYWAASFECILKQHGARVRFLPYEAFCRNPSQGLRVLAELVESQDPDALLRGTDTIRPSRPHELDNPVRDPALLDRVRDVYSQVLAVSDVRLA